MGTHNKDYITAFATIPAVRPPLGDELLSSERTTTIAAVASLYEDPGLINKVHRLGGNRYDFHLFVIALQRFELHHSILLGEQGISLINHLVQRPPVLAHGFDEHADHAG